MKENSRVSKPVRGRKREDKRQEPGTRRKKKEEKNKGKRNEGDCDGEVRLSVEEEKREGGRLGLGA
ncbi:hypothetical protein FH972_001085 [Carpinus fangiana]|uniref:Uncharacterized protein n=1 Tax=Carpinus fangiana TaxID=176857 RepID=A0A5N6QDC1_9ROSI|nr:hypothetical protein FH972_001085 [Carpinus fangiana]